MPLETGWFDLLKIWGPLALGWPIAYILIRFIMDHYKADIESRVKLATALDALTRSVERIEHRENV